MNNFKSFFLVAEEVDEQQV